MTLRKLTTEHGEYFVCCVTPFHGQVCPECKTMHENPMQDAVDFHEAMAAEVADKKPEQAPDTDQEEDTTPAPPATTEVTSPSVELTAPEDAEPSQPSEDELLEAAAAAVSAGNTEEAANLVTEANAAAKPARKQRQSR